MHETAVHRCARCGGDHEAVTFEPLTHEIADGDRVLASHWAPCPENGEPILMRFKAAADA